MSQQNVVDQSVHWDERKDVKAFLRLGYPFEEGFPENYRGKNYTLITRGGQRALAYVDDSRQYRAEGKCWKTVGLNESIDECVVIAWKEGDHLPPKNPT